MTDHTPMINDLPDHIDHATMLTALKQMIPGLDVNRAYHIEWQPGWVSISWRDQPGDPMTDTSIRIPVRRGTPPRRNPESTQPPTPSLDLTTGRTPTHRAGEPPTHPR